MGIIKSWEMAGAVNAGQIRIEEALMYHLRGNHYPPVPASMIEPCKQAIEFVNCGMWDEMIELPDGITWRDQTSAPANEIVDAHHLECFLDEDEDY